MSTECVPLSISTPPPAIAGSAFHRRAMSTRDVNEFSSTMSSPRMPERTIWWARMTSSTKRNFAAIVKTTPACSAAASISDALCTSIASGFSHSTWRPRSIACRTISGCVAGGVQTSTASTSASSSSARCDGYAVPRTCLGERVAAARAHVGDRGDPRAGDRFEHADVGLGDPARADEPHLQRRLRKLGHRLLLDQVRDGGADRVGEELDVLRLVALVPGQHEDVIEELVGAGEAVRRVVERLGPGER